MVISFVCAYYLSLIYTLSTSSYYIIIRDGILVFVCDYITLLECEKEELEVMYTDAYIEKLRLNSVQEKFKPELFVDAFMTAAHDGFFFIHPTQNNKNSSARCHKVECCLRSFGAFFFTYFYFLFSFFPKCEE